MQPLTGTSFKFKYVQNRQAKGLTAKKATAGADGLDLNGQMIQWAGA